MRATPHDASCATCHMHITIDNQAAAYHLSPLTARHHDASCAARQMHVTMPTTSRLRPAQPHNSNARRQNSTSAKTNAWITLPQPVCACRAPERGDAAAAAAQTRIACR
jgi:hypothetical protein